MLKKFVRNVRRGGLILVALGLLNAVGFAGEPLRIIGQSEGKSSLSPRGSPHQRPKDEGALVFILSGQSNMHGQSPLTEAVWDLQDQSSNVQIYCAQPYHFYDASDRWRAGIQLPRWEALRPCGSNSEVFGPEISFGVTISRLFPGRPIKLIKFAHGGTSLFCEWQPPHRSKAYLQWDGDKLCPKYLRSIDYKTPSHPWAYRRLIRSIDAALQGLKSKSWTFGGMLWVQGEADADGREGYHALAEGYGENLKHFVEIIRARLNAPELPFVAAKIKCGYQSNARGQNPIKIVRDSMDLLEDQLDRFGVAETWDLSMQEDRGDCCHFGTSSMLALGERLGKALVGNEGPISFPPPAVADCRDSYGPVPP